MEDKNQERFVEELLEVSLARRTRAELREGLEERILASLALGRQRYPWFARRWSTALAAAAVVLLVAVVALLSRQGMRAPEASPGSTVAQAPRAPVEAAPETSDQPEEMAAVSPRPLRRPRRGPREAEPAEVTDVPVALPRRPQFPSPAPLSEQERLLLQFAQQAPRELVTSVKPMGSPIEELKVDELHIPALRPEEFRPAPRERGE